MMADQDNSQLIALAKQQADKVMGKIPVLGAVSWLMMQHSATRHTLLSELEWRVMPPLMLDQAKLYMRDKAPLAYVSWAMLSDETAQRYQQAPHHLSPADWQGGSQIWLIDLVAPFGGAQTIWTELSEGQFKGQTIHRLGEHLASPASQLSGCP